MPVYLDTRGNSVLSVAICDRCSRKFAYTELMPDPNFPGMRVCKDDLDNYDPWRLPARQTENIALRFPRPDVSVAVTPNMLNTQGNPNNPQQYNNMFLEGILPAAAAQGDLTTASGVDPTLRISINSITPSVGTRIGGYTANILGSNFNNIVSVSVGGAPAEFNVIDPNNMQITLPPYGVAGNVTIIVTSRTDSTIALNIFRYT
ncbi:MAG: hypothetical protein EBT04_14060 [Betaproteobacteria bacterium]|jgi:hypothetical protein|nr:hypothetical protein [Betaproteobacteria bacterium]